MHVLTIIEVYILENELSCYVKQLVLRWKKNVYKLAFCVLIYTKDYKVQIDLQIKTFCN